MNPPALRRVMTAAAGRAVVRHGRASRVAIVVGSALGAGLFFRPEYSGAEIRQAAAQPSPAVLQVAASLEHAPLGQVIADLERELGRLDEASRRLDSRADELFGPEVEGTRRLKLPEDHAGLIRYLNNSVAFVDEVVSSFEELIPCEDQVDLKERIPEARKHLSRLEKSGMASMLARRQVRAWINKDMHAVEALCNDWDEIEPAARQFVATARGVEQGSARMDDLARQHGDVLTSASSRTLFKQSKLGVLCQQTLESARRLRRQDAPDLVTNGATSETALTLRPK